MLHHLVDLVSHQIHRPLHRSKRAKHEGRRRARAQVWLTLKATDVEVEDKRIGTDCRVDELFDLLADRFQDGSLRLARP
jgi:hypothetical protein